MVQPWTLDKELLQIVLDRLNGENGTFSLEVVRSLLDEAFAASLMREEGRSIFFSLAAFGITNPDIAFAQPIAFVAENLRRLAPVLSDRLGFLIVRLADGVLELTGVLRTEDLAPGSRSVPDGVVVSVLGPGHLTVAFRGEELVEISPNGWWPSGGISRELAVYNLIDNALSLARKGELRSVQAVGLLWVVRGMQRHGHGGTLLVLTSECLDGLEMKFPVAQGSSLLRDAVAKAQGAAANFHESITSVEWIHREWTKRLPYRLAETIANLSAVDGAVVMMVDLTILGFGAFMGFGGSLPASIQEYTLVSEKDGCRPRQTRILNTMTEAGGARHQAAVRFAHRHAGHSVAFVASQDGGLSLVVGCTDGTVAIIRCG